MQNENIKVAIRIRPQNVKEHQQNDDVIWKVDTQKCVSLLQSVDYIGKKKITSQNRMQLKFDSSYDQNQTTLQLYDSVVQSIVKSSLLGINGSIFMYGQTGAGKTYTMIGEEYFINKNDQTFESINSMQEQEIEDSDCSKSDLRASNEHGILIYGLKDLFQLIEKDVEKTYIIKCSYYEIYNEHIYDLMSGRDCLHEVLNIFEDDKKEFYVKGLLEVPVQSIQDILKQLSKGESNRHYAQTSMNHQSSRSHTIFTLNIQGLTNQHIKQYRAQNPSDCNANNQLILHQININDTLITSSVLNFIDLAGSERVSNHDVDLNDSISSKQIVQSQERVKEGKYINQSLFFLTQVISLQSKNKLGQFIILFFNRILCLIKIYKKQIIQDIVLIRPFVYSCEFF